MNKKGFTLVEVIAVTLIIAALALLVVPSFKNSALTNQMEKAKVGLVELTTAVKLYREAHTEPISGVFDNAMFNALTDPADEVYLRNANRWAHRPGSATEYSLIDVNGVLNCQYTITAASSTSPLLSSALCQFPKVDEDGTECYNFYMEKANPAVIKKQDGDCSGL